MKITSFFLVLICAVNYSFAQIKVQKIDTEKGKHFITTVIGYPTNGTYLYDGITEPIIELKADGTGIFQLKDLTKNNIEWGIECSPVGAPLFEEGFNSAAYTFWYKNQSEEENWVSAQFSIHFDKKKMYLLGERCKEYSEEIE